MCVQDEETNTRDAPANEVVRRAYRLPPLMSDALDTPRGGLQGLAWFWAAFVCDEWGNVANDLLEPTQQGLARRQGRKLGVHNLVCSCTYGVVDVRIQPPQPEAPPPQPTSTRKRGTKHKRRTRVRG